MKIKEGFIKSEVMGQAVVVATKKSQADFNMLKLNETASDIWDAIVEGLTEQEIAQNLAAKYETTIEQATEDTYAFIKQLQELDIL